MQSQVMSPPLGIFQAVVPCILGWLPFGWLGGDGERTGQAVDPEVEEAVGERGSPRPPLRPEPEQLPGRSSPNPARTGARRGTRLGGPDGTGALCRDRRGCRPPRCGGPPRRRGVAGG